MCGRGRGRLARRRGRKESEDRLYRRRDGVLPVRLVDVGAPLEERLDAAAGGSFAFADTRLCMRPKPGMLALAKRRLLRTVLDMGFPDEWREDVAPAQLELARRVDLDAGRDAPKAPHLMRASVDTSTIHPLVLPTVCPSRCCTRRPAC